MGSLPEVCRESYKLASGGKGGSRKRGGLPSPFSGQGLGVGVWRTSRTDAPPPPLPAPRVAGGARTACAEFGATTERTGNKVRPPPCSSQRRFRRRAPR